MRPDVRAVLACPDCRSPLADERAALACASCERRYERDGDAASLLPREALGDVWVEKQRLGEAAYSEPPDRRALELAQRFAAFAAPTGLVLDIGCGVETRPPYLQGADVVGLDPLRGGERSFPFVQGRAERLPFFDESFDTVLSATMLDHVPDPAAVLAEARRVLKPDGSFALWIGVVDPEKLREVTLGPTALPKGVRPLDSLRRRGFGVVSLAWRHFVVNRVRAAVARLRLRFRRGRVVADVFAERAAYHFSFFEAETVLRLIRRCGFEIVRVERDEDAEAGHSLFVLARRPALG